MKTTAALLMALGLALPAMTLAQDNRPPRQGQGPAREAGAGSATGPGVGGPQGEGPRRPTPPLMEALDANHDGVIDEEEIKNASAALRKLDKNGDGKLTQDELRPARPDGPRGEGRTGAGPGQARDGERKSPPTDGPRGPGQGPRPPQE